MRTTSLQDAKTNLSWMYYWSWEATLSPHIHSTYKFFYKYNLDGPRESATAQTFLLMSPLTLL